jgi:hypothetical protein
MTPTTTLRPSRQPLTDAQKAANHDRSNTMVDEQTKQDFFAAVEDAGGQVVHNRTYKDERGRFIPEIRLSTPERDAAKEERRKRIIAGMVAEYDRLHPKVAK